tara:strand:- start:2920 stop:3786 length:867 start_codon:yes stop_codon:yes gene_type:complete
MRFFYTIFFAAFCFVASSYQAMAQIQGNPKLYRIHCGEIQVTNLDVFSDTHQYKGQTKDLVVSCYLINVGSNWLLWDTGLPSEIAEKEDGLVNGPFHLKIPVTLREQLGAIGLMPEDITHVGLSHAHFDHAGNTNMFTNAKLIIQQAEYDFLTKHEEEAGSYHMNASSIEYFLQEDKKDQLQIIKGDHDIFGDGRVRTISLPGHTPGHMALYVDLVNTGPVILSGDQWHFIENRLSNGVPSFNYQRADTLASSDRLNRLIKNTGAKLIIQHEPKHSVDVFPALPEFLD